MPRIGTLLVAGMILGCGVGSDKGSAVDEACAGVTCEAGQICLHGGCLALVGEPCLNVGCEAGLMCHEGTCEDSSCESEGDCPDKHQCLDFTCSPIDMTGRSEYRINVTTWDGTEYAWEADLTDKLEYFSFGSAHIGTAVALAIG